MDGAMVRAGTVNRGQEGGAGNAGLEGRIEEVEEEGVEVVVEAAATSGATMTIDSSSNKRLSAWSEEEVGDIVAVMERRRLCVVLELVRLRLFVTAAGSAAPRRCVSRGRSLEPVIVYFRVQVSIRFGAKCIVVFFIHLVRARH